MTTDSFEGRKRDLCVMMPIYDDWESAFILIGHLEQVLVGTHFRTRFLLVDDFSGQRAPESLPNGLDGAVIDILHLRRNLGHQRAIAVGLTHLQQETSTELVMVLDADGEDTPEGAIQLLRKFDDLDGRVLVFAQRARRTEKWLFRTFYSLYRVAFRLLTGQTIREGNFSVIPAAHLETLVAVSELWNHYASSVHKAKLPVDRVPVDRGHRIAGSSKMNLVSLLAHGIGAIAVFSEVAALRMLLATLWLAGMVVGAIGLVIAIRLGTDLAIPGWATNATGMLLIVFLQASLLLLVFVFIVIQGRKASSFIPLRDCEHFVAQVVRLRATSDRSGDHQTSGLARHE